MDDVGREEQRDSQPALLQGDVLDRPGAGRADAVEEGSDLTFADHVGDAGRIAVLVDRIDLLRAEAERIVEEAELSRLLLDRHSGDQGVDA